MMKRALTMVIPLLMMSGLFAQGENAFVHPVKWNVEIVDQGQGTYDLVFNGHIEKGWYVYSQENFGDMGPLPTTFLFDTTSHYSAVGLTEETGEKEIQGLDPVFEIEVKKFKGSSIFTQRVKALDASKNITGSFEFMTCNDESCLPPELVYFQVILSEGKYELGTLPFDPNSSIADLAIVDKGLVYKMPKVDLSAPVLKCDGTTATVTEGKSMWGIFLLGFIGGLLALLTPCVFPMIPLTVSFFTKGSEDRATGLRNAITYGAFIFLIYLLFSLPFHLLGSVNPEIFNEISTNPWLNIFFFVVFIVFAISFFGYFEITLPSSWVNKMDTKANTAGGMLGTFFMALTLALVSFSCTGPILGSLLAGTISPDGGAWQLTAGMGGFGLALALPFALFAMFPRWMNALPSSGGWLNSVKVVLGFAEIALAFKFLSNADLVKHWGILPYEVFMAIWVLCALGIVIYLLGKLKFPHDSPVRKFSVMRMAFIVLFGVLTVYLSMGFRYNSETSTFSTMKLMSGLAPPVGYSYIYPMKCPANLDCYHDLEVAMAQARKVGKPVMVDFTGYACVNCRKMEEHVWPEPEVYDLIKDKYVLVSLYVDDKKELPKEEQHIYESDHGVRKPIITEGNKWATLEIETFGQSTQPLYALLSPDGQLLTDPVAYTPDVDEYRSFLLCGLTAMKQLNSAEATK